MVLLVFLFTYFRGTLCHIGDPMMSIAYHQGNPVVLRVNPKKAYC